MDLVVSLRHFSQFVPAIMAEQLDFAFLYCFDIKIEFRFLPRVYHASVFSLA